MGGTPVRDEELARALYAQHAGVLLAFVQRLLGGDRPAAEDIVQETLLRAWRNADRLPPNAIRPWLFTTARHLVIDAYRARRARPVDDVGRPDRLDRGRRRHRRGAQFGPGGRRPRCAEPGTPGRTHRLLLPGSYHPGGRSGARIA